MKPMKPRQRQAGFVLPIVLTFLVVMMFMGVTAIRNVTLEERVAFNLRGQQLAFQAAEEALRYCQNMVESADPNGNYQASGPFTEGENVGKEHWEVPTLWTQSRVSTTPRSLGTVVSPNAEPPKCLIEDMGTLVSLTGVNKRYFRVTARGVGAEAEAVKVLQSYVVL